MKNYLDEIDIRFPVRNSEPQKEAFRSYVLGEAGALRYPVSVGTLNDRQPSRAHRNIVIGDPKNAKVVFTAHYDTPRRAVFPNLMLPLNPALKYIYTFIPIMAMLAVSLWAANSLRGLTGLEDAAGRALNVAVFSVVYFGLLLLLTYGPANLHNRNDNTSGTAAVLTLAAKLAGIPDASFILFDNEEKGKKGSKAYAKFKPEIKSSQLIVNLDCVGNGSYFIGVASEAAMKDPRFPALSSALEIIGAKLCSSRKGSLNSDHKSFDKGVGICACRYRKWPGYYTPYIHTRKDTVASADNIVKLTDALASFVHEL